MRGKKVSPELVSRMIGLAQQGLTCDEMSEALDIHRATIRSRLVALGVPFEQTPKPFWTEEELKRAAEMRASGISFKKIGQAMGRTETAVREKMINAGLHTAVETEKYFVDLRPSRKLLDARDHKYEMEARRTLGETLMGDPPPGFSALDQKRKKGWQAQLAPWGRG